MLASLMTGSFIVEQIVAIPGLGREFFSAIVNRDYTMIMGTTIVLATLIIVANVIVDILYKIIDPRIKLKDVYKRQLPYKHSVNTYGFTAPF